MNRLTGRRPSVRQRGAILIVSLLMLLVLTMLALTTMRAATFEERMAGNARDVNLSFQAAEAALRAAEEGLLAMNAQPTACTSLPCDLTVDVLERGVLPADVRTVNWNAVAVDYGSGRGDAGAGGTGDVAHVADEPQVVVEHFKTVTGPLLDPDAEVRLVYRVTARAVGGTETAQTIVESTIARYPP